MTLVMARITGILTRRPTNITLTQTPKTMPVAVHSTASLFANDCIVYRPIRNNDDTIILQNDLNKIAEWEFIMADAIYY